MLKRGRRSKNKKENQKGKKIKNKKGDLKEFLTNSVTDRETK